MYGEWIHEGRGRGPGSELPSSVRRDAGGNAVWAALQLGHGCHRAEPFHLSQVIRHGVIAWALIVAEPRGAVPARSKEGPVPSGKDALNVVKGRDNDLPANAPPEQEVVRAGPGKRERLVDRRLTRPRFCDRAGDSKRGGQSEGKVLNRVKGEKIWYPVR